MELLSKAKGVFNQGVINLYEDVIRHNLLNVVLSSPGLQIGTTSKKEVRINATTVYKINGEFKSKSAAEVGFTATTHDIAANANKIQERYYLFTINAGGTVTITAGDQADSGEGVLPEIPAGNVAVLGWVKIAIAAGSTKFDATTDDLDAAHITDTYFSGSVIPSMETAQ